MIVRIISRLLSFPVLILIYKYKHHNTDDDERDYCHSHGDPEKCVSPLAVIRSYWQIIIVEVCKRIPEETAKAYDHKNQEECSINFICCSSFFVLHTFCNGYKVANPEDHVKNRQNQYYTQRNYQTHHISFFKN
jgi:hypothetical protein